MIREAFSSEANVAIIPAQDLLVLASGARMNFPGVAKGNWQWRLKSGELSRKLAQRLGSLTLSNGRLQHTSIYSGEKLQAEVVG